jgi:NADH-quinone oxidoreductase subunit M
MGLPGLGDFVGEFMILLGVYQKSRILTAVAAIGILASTIYALKIVQYAFHGPNQHHWALPDLGVREAIIFTPMIVILLWLGLYPQPVINTFNPAMETLQQHAGQTMNALRR